MNKVGDKFCKYLQICQAAMATPISDPSLSPLCVQPYSVPGLLGLQSKPWTVSCGKQTLSGVEGVNDHKEKRLQNLILLAEAALYKFSCVFRHVCFSA